MDYCSRCYIYFLLGCLLNIDYTLFIISPLNIIYLTSTSVTLTEPFWHIYLYLLQFNICLILYNLIFVICSTYFIFTIKLKSLITTKNQHLLYLCRIGYIFILDLLTVYHFVWAYPLLHPSTPQRERLSVKSSRLAPGSEVRLYPLPPQLTLFISRCFNLFEFSNI